MDAIETETKTYEDGVMDTVLFVMEEIASGLPNDKLVEQLWKIHGTVMSGRIANFRRLYT